MKGILPFLLVCLNIHTLRASGIAPFWIVPSSGSDSYTLSEGQTVGEEISILFASDNENDPIVYSIATQVPPSPAFVIGGNDQNVLQVPSGLDAETATTFTLTFGANDGTNTAISVAYTITVTDVNEFTPTFSSAPYSGSVTVGDASGTSVVTVLANDADVTSTVSHTITDGNTGSTFAIAPNTGLITLSVSSNLNPLTTPSYSLTIRASDGTNTATVAVTITVLADTDINECLSNNGGCDSAATCTNTIGSRTCSCNTGYTGDGLTCTDIDECRTANPCDATNAVCTNSATPGVAPTCICKAGWIGTGTLSSPCTDIDECVTANPCDDTNAVCTNSASAVVAPTCTCNAGWTGTGTTSSLCTDIDECETANPCDATNAVCTNSATPDVDPTCTCKAGWTGTGTTSSSCTDIDECETANPCDATNAVCTNSANPGVAPTCTCNAGWTGTGTTASSCTEIDECGTANPCDATNAVCTNSATPVVDPTCTCNAGWTGTGTTSSPCTDTNECLTGNGGCDAAATCANTPGSRTCTCNAGYIGPGLVCADYNAQNRSVNDGEKLIEVNMTIQTTDCPSDLLTNITVYEKVKADLTKMVKANIASNRRVFIFNIRCGAILFDSQIIVNEEDITTLAVELQVLRDGLPMTFNNNTVTVDAMNVAGNELAINSQLDHPTQICEVYTSIAPCSQDHVCRVQSGKPFCKYIEKDHTNLLLGLGLGVALPLILLLIVLAIYLYCKRIQLSHPKHKQRRHQYEDESTLSQQWSMPRVGQHHNNKIFQPYSVPSINGRRDHYDFPHLTHLGYSNRRY